MSDEEVIKRRLLIDGDGTGDDRRLNVLMKTFIKWANCTDTPETSQIMYNRMLAQLAQCEFAVTKSDFASRVMKQELKNYEAISETIFSGIGHAKSQIEQSKENLVLAKKIRKNRMEYDVLAKIITQQPDRKKTTKKLETLKMELNELENHRRQLQRKLEIRRSEFTVLMRSIKELQTKLDDENDNGNNGDEDDDDGGGGDGVGDDNNVNNMMVDDDNNDNRPQSDENINAMEWNKIPNAEPPSVNDNLQDHLLTSATNSPADHRSSSPGDYTSSSKHTESYFKSHSP